MRKVLLLAALAMVATLVFAPAVLAQDVDCSEDVPQAEEQAIFEAAGPDDPNRLDADDDGIACEEPGDSGSTASPTPSASPIASTTGGPLTPLPSASGSPSPSASATATPTAAASVLPETGGPAAAISIVSLVLIVGTGIMAFGITRRS